MKIKGLLVAFPILAALSLSSCSTAPKSLTEEEAAEYVAPIIEALEDETTELSKTYHGPRSKEISYLNVDCKIIFVTDTDAGYYYLYIKEWHDDVNDYVTSVRWLYGSGDSSSAGYMATQGESTVTALQKWTYDGALSYMNNIVSGHWDRSYLLWLSCIGEGYGLYGHDVYDFVSFETEGDEFTYKMRYASYGDLAASKDSSDASAGADTWIYTFEAENGLPTRITQTSESDPTDTDNRVSTFYFGSDIQRAYPAPEGFDDLEAVYP